MGKTGVVTGTIICNDADVEGKIVGRLEIKNLLSIKTSAHIEGEVITGKLAVEPGATFNASCEMKGNLKSLSNAKGKGERSA